MQNTNVIMPWWTEPQRHTVVSLCVCVCVCLSVTHVWECCKLGTGECNTGTMWQYLKSKGAFTWTPRSESNAHSIQFVSVHMNLLKFDALRMHVAFNPPYEVVWKRIVTGLHYYSWFTQGYAYHDIFGLLVGLAFVDCGVCYIVSFCSALAATLGKKQACFLKAEKSGAAR